VRNLYFELTEEFNAGGPIALLASGQAVVYYRLAIMSKDGDWVLRETPEACRRVLDVLARHGARYRPAAPLDVRWLAGGWSSHFEFADPRGRRVRCDFVTRPPRVDRGELDAFFAGSAGGPHVVAVEPLIRMKRTQRAKDYAAIGELARLLPPERELELTTDPDRVVALAAEHGRGSRRPAVRAARAGEGRDAVVVALAREADRFQQADRDRLLRYELAAADYLRAARGLRLATLDLPAAHARLLELAEELLPRTPPGEGDGDADAQ
jgi:hypothetical protein